MSTLQVRAVYMSYYRLQTQTGLEMEMMGGRFSHLIMAWKYQSASQDHFTPSVAAGFSNQSHPNNSSLLSMPLMLQSNGTLIWLKLKYIKDVDDKLSIIRLRFGESSKPLFRNREFIVYETVGCVRELMA